MSVNMKNWQELKKPNSLDVKAGGDARRKATFVAEPLERGLGAAVARAREGGQALEAEPAERDRRDQRLRLAVRPRAPPAVPEPAPDGGAAVTSREVCEAGHPDRPVVGVDDEQV